MPKACLRVLNAVSVVDDKQQQQLLSFRTRQNGCTTDWSRASAFYSTPTHDRYLQLNTQGPLDRKTPFHSSTLSKPTVPPTGFQFSPTAIFITPQEGIPLKFHSVAVESYELMKSAPQMFWFRPCLHNLSVSGTGQKFDESMKV